MLVITGVNLHHVRTTELQTAVFSLNYYQSRTECKGNSGVNFLTICQCTSVLIRRDSSHSHLIFTAFTAAAS